MSPMHSPSFDRPARRSPRPGYARLVPVVPVLLLLAGCANPLPPGASDDQQIAASGCYNNCAAAKSRCDAAARADYRDCQAGYTSAFRDFRWCLASATNRADCGYPGWPCAENLFGACTNRQRECQARCREVYGAGL